MCQLILANTHNKTINRLFYFMLTLKDSDVSNKDGFGYTTGERVYRTEKTPIQAGIGTVVGNSSIDTGTIAGHVRQASFGTIAFPKLVGIDHSHPFVTEDYILMHNGTLEFKDSKELEKYKDKQYIDSRMFVLELQEMKNKTPTELFPVILNKTMAKFRGKFAFIIYEKATKSFFIIRGKTADLHMAKVIVEGVPGIVINTALKELKESLGFITELGKVLGIEMSYEEPVIIKPETINILNPDSIQEIGIITETVKPLPVTIWEGYEETPNYYGRGYNRQYYEHTPKELDPVVSEIVAFMVKAGVEPEELDEIWYHMFGNGLLNITTAQAKSFTKTALPAFYKRHGSKQFQFYQRLMEKFKAYNIASFFGKTGLQFPYMLNDASVLKRKLEV
jgi:predicted glutamine amidotransferase